MANVSNLNHLWRIMITLWPFLVLMSTFQLIFCLLTVQYVLAIYNACVFILGFMLLGVAAFRFQLPVLLYLILSLGAFSMGAFFIVADLANFWECSFSGCQTWRKLFYDFNYFLLVFTVALHAYIMKVCWAILSGYNVLHRQRIDEKEKKS